MFVQAQVGINTDSPNATLDVRSSNTDVNKVDGFIPPILTGAQLKAKENLYTALQTGTIVYVSEPLNPIDSNEVKTNVSSIGYYYFDGVKWVKLNENSGTGSGVNTNIYTNDGSLGDHRTVDLGNKSLKFSGTTLNGVIIERRSSGATNTSYLTLRKNKASGLNQNGAVQIGENIGAISFSGNTGSGYNDDIARNTSIYATAAENFTEATKGSNLSFRTVALGTTSGTTKMTITSEGNVGIGTASPTEKLDVNGQMRIRGGSPGLGKVLTSDANGLATWETIGNLGTTSPVTANNGLTITEDNTMQLGGDLIKPTTITSTSASQLKIDGSVKNAFSVVSANEQGNVTSTNLSVDNLNNRVGIGTNSPDTNLHVAGQVKITGGSPGVDKVLTSDANGLAKWDRIEVPISHLSLSGSYVLEAGQDYTKYTGKSIKLPPGTWLINFIIPIQQDGLVDFARGTNFVRLRLRDTQTDNGDPDANKPGSISADAIFPKLASSGFSLNQVRGTLNGSLAINNSSNADKTYYLFVDNTAEYPRIRTTLQFGWVETYISYYPIDNLEATN